jgi:hypothetical protein
MATFDIDCHHPEQSMTGLRWLGDRYDRLLQLPTFAVEKPMSLVSLGQPLANG